MPAPLDLRLAKLQAALLDYCLPKQVKHKAVMSRMLSILVLVAILVAIGVVFFRVMSGFLVPVFFAALLGVVFHPLHLRVEERFGKYSRYVAAGITTFIAAFAVVAPMALIITLAIFEGFGLVNQFGDRTVRQRVSALR